MDTPLYLWHFPERAQRCSSKPSNWPVCTWSSSQSTVHPQETPLLKVSNTIGCPTSYTRYAGSPSRTEPQAIEHSVEGLLTRIDIRNKVRKSPVDTRSSNCLRRCVVVCGDAVPVTPTRSKDGWALSVCGRSAIHTPLCGSFGEGRFHFVDHLAKGRC